MTTPTIRAGVAVALGILGVVAFVGAACGGRYQGGWTHEANWPLVGKHAPLTCEKCHPTDQGLVAVSSACASCHEQDRPPDHYPDKDCGQCHTPVGWGEISVDHEFFPLTHSHSLPCESCHTNGTYDGLSQECSSCHETDRPADHYPGQDCASCHTWTTWGDITFDHDFFPLTMSHDIECESCHTNGTFEGLDPACASCHEGDRPAGHYTGDCGECHTWSTWGEWTHDHTFRIPHHGADQCVECHPQAPDSYTPSCTTGCHPAGETNNQHDEVGGYSYDSAACIDCHPTGEDD